MTWMTKALDLLRYAAVALALSAFPASAKVAVDLELALAIDVSGSIDEVEANLQRAGYIAAFRNPRVIDAIQHGILGRIAVAYYEWAGYGHNKMIADWTVIHDRASALAFAESLHAPPPETARRTAIGSAIAFGAPLIEANDIEGTRRVINISGDGPNNWGQPATVSRDFAVAAGITINGLPIVNDRPSRWGWPSMPDLDLYYRDCVIGGPGSFLVVANTFEDFAAAVLKKLIMEIAGARPPGRIMYVGRRKKPLLLAAAKERLAPPCDIGERRWRDRDDY
jgi:hypothetical protein